MSSPFSIVCDVNRCVQVLQFLFHYYLHLPSFSVGCYVCSDEAFSCSKKKKRMNCALIRIVLHPASSVVLAAALCSAVVFHAPFISKVLLLFFGVLTYMILRPGARRNKSLWRALSRHGPSNQAAQPGRADGGASSCQRRCIDVASLKGNCVIVSIPVCESIDIIDHALAFSEHAASFSAATSLLSNSTVMYVCRKPLERAIFWLPLARLMLWLLGGLMEYSRGLLLQLLKSKSNHPLLAIVLLPPPTKTSPPLNNKSSSTKGATAAGYQLTIQQKGIFAAALKTGATVVPALVQPNGTVAYGKSMEAEAKEGIAVPSPDQVRHLSTSFAAELSQLYKDITSCELRVQ